MIFILKEYSWLKLKEIKLVISISGEGFPLEMLLYLRWHESLQPKNVRHLTLPRPSTLCGVDAREAALPGSTAVFIAFVGVRETSAFRKFDRKVATVPP